MRNNLKYEFNKTEIHHLFESEDLAMIDHYKVAIEIISDNIERHLHKLDKYNNTLAELKEKEHRLKEKYPEEYI
ncbi:MAG: hypothetical protein HQ521_06640 [Bacteroidetes bacterium]|nr:hypothetical protein [Bacteroidota bacterium]